MNPNYLGSIAPLLIATTLQGQLPGGLDVSALKQELMAGVSSQGLSIPSSTDITSKVLSRTESSPEQKKIQEQRDRQDRALEEEIYKTKAMEQGPRRFGADLFDFRAPQIMGTEGGVSEDYVLGVGDQLKVNVFGSANFDLELQVDGRGDVIIPKLGVVKVGGKNLPAAKRAIQHKVTQNYSRSEVDLAVIKLREVRVFIMGEVYKPGSYLAPSLSSLVNVLAMAGGPTPAGSFRQIRVMRGGKAIHSVDLYPLRAEGQGNLNFCLQNGDTLFVPLAFNQVILEGAFTRVVSDAEAQLNRKQPGKKDKEQDQPSDYMLPEAQRDLLRQIRRVEARLEAPGQLEAETLTPMDKAILEEHLQSLRDQLRELKASSRGDQRVSESPALPQSEQPKWLTRWQLEGAAPRMQFEMIPGETAADALRYAGGLVTQAFSKRLSLRRMDGNGTLHSMDVVPTDNASIRLERGDILSALPLRENMDKSIHVQGWVRVPGSYARKDGMKVGDLLIRENQILPDTYMGRGEIVRTAKDGSSRYLAFDLAKALEGDPDHNLPLEDRDRVDIYRVEDFRTRKTVKVVGPVSRPGTFEFHEGMRASDLLFRAGIPLRQADTFVAELSHTRDGKVSAVTTLDLTKLLSNEQKSPVNLKDDAINPKLEAFDQLSIYEKPDYKIHRVVRISGQVHRPGTYTVNKDGMGIRDLIARAGGLTEDAMPAAGIFLRKLGGADQEKSRAAQLTGVSEADPTSNGINEVLNRLDETKRQPHTGTLLRNPLLHGLQTGAINRLVVNFPAVIINNSDNDDVTLQDGDEILIPRKTDAAYVVGETASPFAAYKLTPGMRVKDLLSLAGGPTRNADTWNIRLLKADGRILDSWVKVRKVEPGDAVLVPQLIRKDSTWHENLAAITPLAMMYNAVKK